MKQVVFTPKEKKKIRKKLTELHYSKMVILWGIETILSDWQKFVKECETGYDDDIEEYKNDLDTREIIEKLILSLDDAILVNKIKEAINDEDNIFKGLLIQTDKCIWGPRVQKDYNYNSVDQWWLFGVIKTASGKFLEDLHTEKQYHEFDLTKLSR
jgi:hypothetical protein